MPPIQTRVQALPFNELTWPNFERLILRLVRREKEVVDCAVYGTPGQAQEGLDILAAVAGEPDKPTCYQCKKVQEFGPSDIRRSVDTFLAGKWTDKTTEFTLCLAISLESTQQQDEVAKQRERLEKRGIRLTIWDGAAAGAISERLKQLPELVDDFFGRPWVACFNGEDAATCFGDRLDGVELGRLRQRLASLYATLFAQHDPGLRTERSVGVTYLDRYVPADVTERAVLSTSRSSQPVPSGGDSDDATARSGHDQDRKSAHTTSQPGVYEAR